MEIKENEFIRTKTGKIDKVINNNYYMSQYIECEKRIVEKENIVKHSFNIIDLIEVGDIVKLDDEFIEYRLIDVFDESIIEGLKQDIKTGVKINSILTKEQYKRNCYTVEREKDENTEDIKKE